MPPTEGQIRDRKLMQVLLNFAHTMASDYSAADALDELLHQAPSLLGVDGLGVMLLDDNDDLRFVSASDDRVRLIEQLQLDYDEGPCLLAYITGTPIYADDLRQDTRFPTFGPVAVESGLAAVHSFPMRVGDTRLGALNLYRSTAGPLDESSKQLGGLFADMASSYLVSARQVDEVSRQVVGIRQALERNGVIEQAKGVLIHGHGLTADAAFDLLRHHARSTRRRVLEVAEAFMDGRLTATDLGLDSHRVIEMDRHG
ncbi:GAF and ANTAR domain-containing protein [Euzebya rosea]|uniref:GAF and ANTAR domain-containing protein n=1 Tax=Euzebya rosea TaxID=2052804 RepID=UPI000D3E9E34|nr:GAF and ANTAR domain-containing protein [Euzebya rosea]